MPGWQLKFLIGRGSRDSFHGSDWCRDVLKRLTNLDPQPISARHGVNERHCPDVEVVFAINAQSQIAAVKFQNSIDERLRPVLRDRKFVIRFADPELAPDLAVGDEDHQP